MNPIISVRGLSKKYKLGVFNAKTLREEAEAFFARFKRKNAHTAEGIRHTVSGPATSNPLPATAEPSSDFWALRDVSFDVQPGEVIGIIGRNGAGKSTLLKILSRITEPTTGEAHIRGRVASLLEVGTGFHPELSGRENIFLNGAILGMTKAEIRAKFDEIVAFAEIEKFIDTPVKRYSSGMYVRLAFAVAAHLEPEILIVDEVLAVGDASFQKKCLGKMQEVSGRDGRTVLFVSHNMAAIEALCSRAILLSSGTVEFSGDTRTATKSYLNVVVETSQKSLSEGLTKHIKSIRLTTQEGESRKSFQVGESILFEIELTASSPVPNPRFGIGIHGATGERIATLHTDVQQNQKWSLDGTRVVRVLWSNVPLNVGEYRIDASLWGFDYDLETLIGCKTLTIKSKDVYGTGVLPDSHYQGHIVPVAKWYI